MPFPFASPDRLLTRFVRTGDARALGKLFDRTAPELLRLAAWLCGNRADAEDLLQRTFLTVLTKQGGYDPARRAMPWLCGILGNHAKKLHEQRQLRAATGSGPVAAANDDPLRDAADSEFAAAVARVRTELGSPYAEVLDLHLAEGLDAKRIAERLGRPAGTVRTQIVRGLELLRRHLPRGFVAGLGLGASVQAASLAVVRAAVMAQATAAANPVAVAASASGAFLTFGGMVMGKKLVWFVPAVLLLLGSGAFWWQQQAGAHVPRTPTPPVAAAFPDAAPIATSPAANAAESGAAREAAATADAPVAEPGLATLVLRLHWADDGTPAANVGVLAVPYPRNELHEREGRSDATGTAVLHRILPGTTYVQSAFLSLRPLELAAGEVRTLDVAANRSGFVEGLVVDSTQQPVADARLWLSVTGNPFRGMEVGRSDAQGRFRVAYAGMQHLGACKAGHAPSHLRHLSAPAKDVMLVLRGAGGTVRGKVVDADNRALADACVEVGARGGHVVVGSSLAERLTHASAAKVRTDEHGSFVVEGVAIGDTEVRAWVLGFGPSATKVLVDPDRISETTIVLSRAAAVAGVVRDATGQPIANATVARTGMYYDFARPRSTSAADGSFRLDDLPPGELSLTVSTERGKLDGTVTTTAGATTAWHPVLAESRKLTGRVLGADERPLANVQVGLVAANAFRLDPVATTDASGAFVLSGLEADVVTLVLGRDESLCAERKDVAVTDAPVVLHLTADEEPAGHIRGRVLDAAGNALAAVVTLRRPHWRWCPMTQAGADGAFDRGSLPAGRYLVGAHAMGFGEVRLPDVVLAAGEDRTLPDIVLAPAGRAAIEIRGELVQGGIVSILRGDGVRAAHVTPQGNLANVELPPGDYVAVAEGRDSVARTSFTVRSGQTVDARLALEPAARTAVACDIVGAARSDVLTIVVRDSAGAVVDGVELQLDWQPEGQPPCWSTALPRGAWSFIASVGDGRRALGEVTVADVGKPVHVVLAFPAR